MLRISRGSRAQLFELFPINKYKVLLKAVVDLMFFELLARRALGLEGAQSLSHLSDQWHQISTFSHQADGQ